MAGVVFQWGAKESDAGTAKDGPMVIDVKAVAAEFLAMTLFVIIGCGTACGHGASDGATRLVVALAFGIGIMVLAYTFGHHSGAHINCAVTWSLVLGGHVQWYQGVANTVGQLAGSLAGAGFLAALFPCDQDLTTNLGTNIVNMEYGRGNAMFGEIIGTFLLCYVVFETAVSPLSNCGKNAPLAIGFAVFLAHLVLLPIDGCSINPSRSFGPAVVGSLRACSGYASAGLEDLRVMTLGPMVGAAFAAILKGSFVPEQAEKAAWGSPDSSQDSDAAGPAAAAPRGEPGRAEVGRERQAPEAGPPRPESPMGFSSVVVEGSKGGPKPATYGKTRKAAAKPGSAAAHARKCFNCMPTF